MNSARFEVWMRPCMQASSVLRARFGREEMKGLSYWDAYHPVTQFLSDLTGKEYLKRQING